MPTSNSGAWPRCSLDSNDAVTVNDFAGENHGLESRAMQMLGYNEAEALRMNQEQLVPEETLAKVRPYWQQLQRGERVPTWESQRRTKDGRILYVLVTGTALRDEAGQPIAIAQTVRDITDASKPRRGCARAKDGCGCSSRTPPPPSPCSIATCVTWRRVVGGCWITD